MTRLPNIRLVGRPIGLAQFAFVQLAGRQSREFIDKIDGTRHHVVRHVVTGIGDEGLPQRVARCHPGRQLHHRFDFFPKLRMRHPEHRAIAERIQATARRPYAEIRNNLIAADCLPIDMLRSKLAYFGASKFDPKSELWTRITLYQGAPLADELSDERRSAGSR